MPTVLFAFRIRDNAEDENQDEVRLLSAGCLPVTGVIGSAVALLRRNNCAFNAALDSALFVS